MSAAAVLARCDCGEAHWLARVALRQGEPGIEYRTVVVGVTRSADFTSPVRYTEQWVSLELLRADDLASMTVAGRCPRGHNYTLDLVAIADGVGGPPLTLTAEHADSIDIRPFRQDLG